MESVEDKVIKQKINSVTELPAGYNPNLQSKWELLQAGLEPRKKRSLLFYVSGAAVAAMLLMIGGAGLYYIKLSALNKAEKKTVIAMPVKKEPLIKDSIQPHQLVEVKQKTKRTYLQKQNVQVQIKAVQDTMMEAPHHELPMVITEEAIAAQPVRRKRFTEIDFSEPVITDKQPSEAFIASQRFKFKIGFGTSSNAAAAENPSILGLKKNLN